MGTRRHLMGWLAFAVILTSFPVCWGAATAHAHSVQKRQAPESDCAQADVVFVLDSSGSVGRENWKRVLNFTKSIVHAFPVGDFGIRVGVISYGNYAYKGFMLNTYNTVEEIDAAIDAIQWRDEMTNTSGGIRMMYDQMFQREAGDRNNIPNLGIVVTDGESNRAHNMTIPEADIARQKGILMFAIGIGDTVKQAELDGIGRLRNGNGTNVFRAGDFNMLPLIRKQLVAAACEAVAACSTDHDITFIFDSSGSVGVANYAKMEAFFESMLEEINVGQDLSHVAFVTYSNNAHVEFDLSSGADTRADVVRKMRAVGYRRGSTNTAAALRATRTRIYGTPADRANFANIIVLLTDGSSNDFSATLREAKLTRADGITILVVGIGNWANNVELYETASDPDELNTFLVADFDDVSRIKSRLKSALCDDILECANNPCQNGGTCVEGINQYECRCPRNYAGLACQIECTQAMDIVIAVDSSSGIGQQHFYELQQFIKSLIRALPDDVRDQTRLGLLSFASQTFVEFNLGDFSTKAEVMNSMSMAWRRGSTDMAGALRQMNAMFQRSGFDRSGVPNLGILITDGRSTNRLATFREAVRIRTDGMMVVGVGVGIRSYYDIREMQGIVSDPDDQNFINAPSYSDLTNVSMVTDRIVRTACNVVNECASSPCERAARCVDGFNKYTCICPRGRTGPRCERRCSGETDIVFLLDSSGSIRRDRFAIMKKFLKGFIEQLQIGEGQARVGLIQFNDYVDVAFHLNTYTMKEDVLQAVEMIDYKAGKTNIADAIRTSRTSMFTTNNGARPNVPKIAILFSDGVATVNERRTLPEAIEARIAGVHLMVVSAEQDSSSLELKGIASDPDALNIYAVERFSQLPTLLQNVVMATCNDQNDCASFPCRNGGRCIDGLRGYTCRCGDRYTGPNCERTCSSRNDVAFILDSSGSVDELLDLQIRLSKRVILGLNFAGFRTQVAMVTFSDRSRVEFYLNKYSDQQSVLNAVAFLQTPGRTHTAAALSTARNNVFSRSRGARGVNKVAIVMTDGFSNINEGRTLPEAERMRSDGTRVMVVGVGRKVNRPELDGMVSTPENVNSFSLRSGEDLDTVAGAILDQLCF